MFWNASHLEVTGFLQPLGTIFKHRSRSKKMLWVRVSDSKREISDPSEMMNWYNLRFTSN